MFSITFSQNNISILHVIYVDFNDLVFFSCFSIFIALIFMLILILISFISRLFIAIFVARCSCATIRSILVSFEAITAILVSYAKFIMSTILSSSTSITFVLSPVLTSLNITHSAHITNPVNSDQARDFLVQYQESLR